VFADPGFDLFDEPDVALGELVHRLGKVAALGEFQGAPPADPAEQDAQFGHPGEGDRLRLDELQGVGVRGIGRS